MSYACTADYVNTRNLAARADGITEIRCPAKLGQVIAAGRCVEMQATCGLAVSCPYAPIAREANRLALVVTSEHMPRHMSSALHPCLQCGEPVNRDRNKTCSTECNAKWMTRDRRHKQDPREPRNPRSVVKGIHVKVIDAETEASMRKALDDGLNGAEIKERFGMNMKSVQRCLRRRDLARSTPAESTQRATDRQGQA